jgi:ABC-type transport system involved in cytochrome c biogenesis permease subunit
MWLTHGFLGAYALGMLGYFAVAGTRNPTIARGATGLSWLGLLMLTAVLLLRTQETGRLPFTSSYGFALCFAWAVTVAHLMGERVLGTKLLGVFVLPIVVALCGYAYLLLPSQVTAQLVPALQNRFWLHVHVSVAVVAYGALALSCATAIMYFFTRRLVHRA